MRFRGITCPRCWATWSEDEWEHSLDSDGRVVGLMCPECKGQFDEVKRCGVCLVPQPEETTYNGLCMECQSGGKR